MPEEITGQVPTTPVTPPAVTALPQASEARTAEDMLAEIANLRKEAGSYRVKAKELDALKATAEAEKLSEVEKERQARTKAEDRATAIQTKLTAERIKGAAVKLGIVDPDLAASLVAGSLELDDDGLPKNAEHALRELLKSKPYLVPTAGSAANPGASATATDNRYFTLAQMQDHAFYIKNRAAIVRAMTDGRIVK